MYLFIDPPEESNNSSFTSTQFNIYRARHFEQRNGADWGEYTTWLHEKDGSDLKGNLMHENVTLSGFFPLHPKSSASELICLVAESGASESYIEVGNLFMESTLNYAPALAPNYFMPIWLPGTSSAMT